MTCKLCDEEKKLIEAHIVPRCVLSPLLSPAGPMIRLTNDPKVYPQSSHTGEYDKNILCAECDNSFSPYDDYAGELLLNGFEEKYSLQSNTNQRPPFYMVPEYDYKKLKLFFLSVLWRMSISSRPAFNRVALGPFETQFQDLLKRKDPGDAGTFPVFLYRYIDDIGSKIMLGAHREKHMDLNVYNIGLPNYIAVIKVDTRSIPIDVSGLVLQPNKPLIIAARQMQNEAEFQLITKIFATERHQ